MASPRSANKQAIELIRYKIGGIMGIIMKTEDIIMGDLLRRKLKNRFITICQMCPFQYHHRSPIRPKHVLEYLPYKLHSPRANLALQLSNGTSDYVSISQCSFLVQLDLYVESTCNELSIYSPFSDSH